jgi:hypothetical protein
MIDFLKKLFSLKTTPPPFTGALPDDRQPSERTEDVHFSEIVAMANAVNSIEKYAWVAIGGLYIINIALGIYLALKK